MYEAARRIRPFGGNMFFECLIEGCWRAQQILESFSEQKWHPMILPLMTKMR